MKIRLNIGSGQRPFQKPWINIDRQAKWNPDLVADGRSLPMFEANSVDMIVLHHILEHHQCGGEGLLEECYRILAPNGSLLIFVPNMWELASMWKEGRLTDQIYFTNVYGAYMGDEADTHKWGYTPVSLMQRLVDMRMHAVMFDWRKIEGADIAGPDRWILGVEAFKIHK